MPAIEAHPPRRGLLARAPLVLVNLSLLAACESSPPEPVMVSREPSKPAPTAAPEATAAPAPASAPGGAGDADAPADARNKPGPSEAKPGESGKVEMEKPVAEVKPSPDDPLKGKFTLEDATKGLPPGKELVATLETSLGKIECQLFEDKAPITVANFVGLARGIRPFKTKEGKWTKKPAYDGTTFHRVIPGFMIQGGDSWGDGTGQPGYVIPDEIWKGAKHDRAGLLCMANRGPNTNGAQFFITDAKAPHLDGGYTIFGECKPLDVISKIASVEKEKGDRPKDPPVIKKVTIRRK